MATATGLKKESKKLISKTHAYHDTEEQMVNFYDELAPDYDDVVHNTYIGYRVAANVLQRFVSSKTARILDVATGTGLVGVQLKELGYEKIDAIDCSEKMIDIARARNVYDNLYVQWIGGGHKLKMDNDIYDVIICAGGFFGNGLKRDCLNEFVRVVKPGGFIVITMRIKWFDQEPNYNDGKLKHVMQQLEKEGFWKLLEKEIKNSDNPDQHLVTFVYLVC